jgi:hypothetical protein
MNAIKKPSDALLRIKDDFLDFCEGVERCRIGKSEGNFKRADWQDAHNRLYTLFERYKLEHKNLTKREIDVLAKVFVKDEFLRSLVGVPRVIGQHGEKRSNREQEHLLLRTKGGAKFTIPVETSARSMFAGPRVNFGGTVTVDHLDNLETAEKRIAAVFKKLST